MLYIGIDVHKRAHEVVILDQLAKPLGRSFKIHNTHDDITHLFERIARLNPADGMLLFGMEATGHYWLTLHHHLTSRGFDVVVLDPLRTHAYRARSIRPAKNDRIDARCVAEIIRTESQSDYAVSDEATLELRQLTRLREELVELVSNQKRRLISILDQAFPEYETFFREKYCKSSLALLQTYPTPADILAAGIDAVAALLEQHSRKQYGRDKAEAIFQVAQRSFGVPFAKNALGIQIKLLAGQIAYMETQQKQLDQEIERYINAIPNQLTSIAGIGKILAAALLGEIGDIRRFKNAKALVAYAGLDPSVTQSGEFVGKRAHISKKGSTHLRRAVWLAATAATRSDPALKALLHKKRTEGKPYHVAIGAVANKMLHIVYAVLRDNKPYYSPSLVPAALAA